MAAITIFINFSWETASVIFSSMFGLGFSQANFIRFSWFFFDIFILAIFLYKFKKDPNNIKPLYPYLLLYCVLTILFFCCFKYLKHGMVISAFIIDGHMEMMFWKNKRKFDPSNRLLIGVFKILGDLFAGIFYCTLHYVAGLLAIVALTFDVLYIIYAVKEKKIIRKFRKFFQKTFPVFSLRLNTLI